jgi:hypothetical protein
MTDDKLDRLNHLYSEYRRAMEKCRLLERLRENPQFNWALVEPKSKLSQSITYLVCGSIEPDTKLSQAIYALARDYYERKARTLKQEFEDA